MNIDPWPVSLVLVADNDEHYCIGGFIVTNNSQKVFIGNAGSRILMEPEWLETAKPITDAIRGIFGPGPSHFIKLSVSNMPTEADLNAYIPIGMKLPK